MINKKQKKYPTSYGSYICNIEDYISKNGNILCIFVCAGHFFYMGSPTAPYITSNALQYNQDLSGDHWQLFEDKHGCHYDTKTPRTPNFDKKSSPEVQFVTMLQMGISTPPYKCN